MAVYSTLPLSGSTNGRPIGIDSTAAPGTTIHTVSTATAVRDHPYVWVYNLATTVRELRTLWGTTATGAEIVQSIPAQDGLYAVSPGPALQGATGIIVGMFATATGALFAIGHADRAT